ncbi:MAG: RdgB/HAM1 family non-canonical purine NTP pyrophosphatase [Chitinophagaceae bacterium]
MTELIFATNNQHKADEIQAVIGDKVWVITLKQAGINIDIAEPYHTLEANASEKSKTIFLLTGRSCFGEDTGLEVEALNGEPGVKSARYAGEEKDFNDNIAKLLYNLGNSTNRKARFRTVISLKMLEGDFLFDGICEGRINYNPLGTNGFGYDSIFIPLESNKTFAEMTMEEKAFFSHRRKASDKLVAFLHNMVIANNQAYIKK